MRRFVASTAPCQKQKNSSKAPITTLGNPPRCCGPIVTMLKLSRKKEHQAEPCKRHGDRRTPVHLQFGGLSHCRNAQSCELPLNTASRLSGIVRNPARAQQSLARPRADRGGWTGLSRNVLRSRSCSEARRRLENRQKGWSDHARTSHCAEPPSVRCAAPSIELPIIRLKSDYQHSAPCHFLDRGRTTARSPRTPSALTRMNSST